MPLLFLTQDESGDRILHWRKREVASPQEKGREQDILEALRQSKSMAPGAPDLSAGMWNVQCHDTGWQMPVRSIETSTGFFLSETIPQELRIIFTKKNAENGLPERNPLEELDKIGLLPLYQHGLIKSTESGMLKFSPAITASLLHGAKIDFNLEARVDMIQDIEVFTEENGVRKDIAWHPYKWSAQLVQYPHMPRDVKPELVRPVSAIDLATGETETAKLKPTRSILDKLLGAIKRLVKAVRDFVVSCVKGKTEEVPAPVEPRVGSQAATELKPAPQKGAELNLAEDALKITADKSPQKGLD